MWALTEVAEKEVFFYPRATTRELDEVITLASVTVEREAGKAGVFAARAALR